MNAVTIIGTGNIGSAVAAIAAKAGANVQVLGRDQDKAAALAREVAGSAGAVGDPIAGETVVLAVPHPALAHLAELYGNQFTDKTLVDVTNPVDFATFDSLVVPAGSSAAEQLQELLPGATVLKAFNTNFASTLASGRIGQDSTTVLVAGDAQEAKRALIETVSTAGLRAVDTGALKRAREMEALAFLQMTLAVDGTMGPQGGFAVVP